MKKLLIMLLVLSTLLLSACSMSNRVENEPEDAIATGECSEESVALQTDSEKSLSEGSTPSEQPAPRPLSDSHKKAIDSENSVQSATDEPHLDEAPKVSSGTSEQEALTVSARDTAAESSQQSQHNSVTTTESSTPTQSDVQAAPTVDSSEVANDPIHETETQEQPLPTEAPVQEPAFDIAYWITYAQGVAVSKGLTLESSAVDCWDNPISANPDCIYIERDINSRLSRYAKDDEITDVWIWYECIGTNNYLVYVGYA